MNGRRRSTPGRDIRRDGSAVIDFSMRPAFRMVDVNLPFFGLPHPRHLGAVAIPKILFLPVVPLPSDIWLAGATCPRAVVRSVSGANP